MRLNSSSFDASVFQSPSFAAVFGMSRNAPPNVTFQKTAAKEISCVLDEKKREILGLSILVLYENEIEQVVVNRTVLRKDISFPRQLTTCIESGAKICEMEIS